LKRRFPILDLLPNDIQMLIIYSCFSLFNLIKLYNTDMDSHQKGRSTVCAASIRRPTDNEAAKRFRDQIAKAMWEQYKEYLRELGGDDN
jgi:hypothetical protein